MNVPFFFLPLTAAAALLKNEEEMKFRASWRERETTRRTDGMEWSITQREKETHGTRETEKGRVGLPFLNNAKERGKLARSLSRSPFLSHSGYRLCLGIRAMDNSSNLLIVQNLDSTERIGISHS